MDFLSVGAEQYISQKLIIKINRKRRRAPVIEDSDSEEGGAQNSAGKRQTRKLKTEKESEEILKSDPETQEQHGFSEEAIDIAQVR